MGILHLAMEWGFRAAERGINLEQAKKEYEDLIADQGGPVEPYNLPMFTDEDRAWIFSMACDEGADLSRRDLGEMLMDQLDLMSCIAYALPGSFELEHFVGMIQHLGNTEEGYVNGEFLREHDDDGDDYAGQLDFAKRMGLINEEETELTDRGKEFVSENS